MKKNLLSVIFVLGLIFSYNSQVNSNSTYVNGYYRQNGTYVEGYYKTTPNSTINDNYSTYPNYNPYTGKQGTVKPDYNFKQNPPAYNSNDYNNQQIQTPIYYTTPTYSKPYYKLK